MDADRCENKKRKGVRVLAKKNYVKPSTQNLVSTRENYRVL